MSDSDSFRRILLVDDQPAIHEDYRKVFTLAEPGKIVFRSRAAPRAPAADRRENFEIHSAFQGAEALEKVQQAAAIGQPYAVAFIDMRMPPGWDGVETTLRLWEVCPDLQVVICTAHSDYSWEEMSARFGQTDRLVLLKKPFDPLEVLQLAHALTEKARLLHHHRRHTAELEARVAGRTRELQAANAALQAEMAERAAIEQAMRQAQKMEAVGQLAAGIAHDFNNLLCVIRGYSGILLEDEKLDASAVKKLRKIDHAAESATHLTRQLLTFCRKQIAQPEYLQLDEVIGKVSSLLDRVLGETVTLKIETTADVPRVLGDRGMIEQMIINLAVNARDAMADGGPLLIRTSVVTFSAGEARRGPDARAGNFACLRVTDRGCGIAPEIMPRLFEPFFTTKEVGKGTGLGLATVYGIVRQHEGWIEVESERGQGTTFTIFLPNCAKPSEGPSPQASPPIASGGRETILVVEDEVALRDLAQLVLQEKGYQVYCSGSGLEALEHWPEVAAEVDLLLTDMVMPGGVSGRELARRVQGEKPSLKVIYSTGYSTEISGADGVLEEGLNLISKPYTPEKLTAMVRACLDRDLHGEPLAV